MNGIDLQKSTHRVFGADDLVFVAAIMGGLAATAQLIEYGVQQYRVSGCVRRAQDLIALCSLSLFPFALAAIFGSFLPSGLIYLFIIL